jgi:Rrf2 family transcriptional regulator, cysteine metabolism repressor
MGRPGEDRMRAALAGQQPALRFPSEGQNRGTHGPMKISAKAEYACLAVLALARHGLNAPPMQIGQISRSYGIPQRYLVQILLQLKRSGLVTSTRGASGGYRLARAATTISLGEVLAAIDGPETAHHPTTGTRRATATVLEPVWETVRAAERAVLDRTTIAQLAEQPSVHEWII